MTNLKKLGLSALAGSLVAISAQAGEMSVTGGANVTYKSKSGGLNTGAGSIGNDKDVAFSGGGELDNGWTFKMTSTLKDDMTLSSNFTTITMGSLGTLTVNGLSAGGAGGKFDEEVPQAYEQTSDAQDNSSNAMGSELDSGSITYTSPAFDFEGVTATIDVDYSPQATDAAVVDGGLNTYSETVGSGTGLGVTLNYDALTVGVYGAEIERKDKSRVNDENSVQGTWYAKYNVGALSFGYQESYHDSGLSVAEKAVTAAKVIGTDGGLFLSNSMSAAYNVNDNLSISYTATEDTYDAQEGSGTTGATATADVTQDTDAFQIAYSMGSMSIKAYRMSTNNPGYDSDASDVTVTEIALGLAF